MTETLWLHMSADIRVIVVCVFVFVCFYSVIRILPINEVMKNAFYLISHFRMWRKIVPWAEMPITQMPISSSTVPHCHWCGGVILIFFSSSVFFTPLPSSRLCSSRLCLRVFLDARCASTAWLRLKKTGSLWKQNKRLDMKQQKQQKIIDMKLHYYNCKMSYL